MGIPKNLKVSRRTDSLSENLRHEEVGEYEGAFIRALDRNQHWFGARYMLYIPVPGERDEEGEQKYERIEMEGAEVSVGDGFVYVEGFVQVDAEGNHVRWMDDHSHRYRREWWTQRGMPS